MSSFDLAVSMPRAASRWWVEVVPRRPGVLSFMVWLGHTDGGARTRTRAAKCKGHSS
jgi:hypothetical protein